MRSRRISALAVVAMVGGLLGLVGPAKAVDSGWVHQGDQPVIDSSFSNENTNARPTQTNLCEGTLGIPFGNDPPWVRVGGSPDPNAPFTEAEGQILPDMGRFTNPFVTHTDAFFDHYTKDINAFITLDPAYRGLLGSGNFRTGEANERAQMEIEWERGTVPLWAYPSANERIHVWGNHVWDCGHGEPLVGPDTGHRAEIHPPIGWVNYRNLANTNDVSDPTPPESKRLQNPWVWYDAGDHRGIGATLPGSGLLDTPVQTTVADAFFSTYGGQTLESLNGCRDETIINNGTVNAPCASVYPGGFRWFQPLLNQDYSFFVPAPPRPGPDTTMVFGAEDHCGEVPANPSNPTENHPGLGTPPNRMFGDIEDVGPATDSSANIGAATCNTIPDQVTQTTENGQPGIRVTVKAQSSGVAYPANHYLAFAKRYKVAWDDVPAVQVRTYRVDVNHLRVYDDNDPCPEDGEWVMSIQVGEKWSYPVRGHGDGNDPFWASGAVDDDKCIFLHDATYQEYSIGESFTVSVVPGELFLFRERSYDIDFFSNDVNPVAQLLISGQGTFEVGDTNTGHDGAHTIGFTVTDITDALPPVGSLNIGTPKYGPNADTGGVPRVNATAAHHTPITFNNPGVNGFEWRAWKDGSPMPSTWNVDLNPAGGLPVVLPGNAGDDGFYTIEWASIKDYSGRKIVSVRQRQRVQVDNTPPTVTVPADITVFATEAGGAHVTFSVGTTDNLPGPVTFSCDHASGDLFPSGKNAPLTTTVTCTATDAVGNQASRSFNVTVKSPFGYIPDFAVLGREWVSIGSDAVVESGNLGSLAPSAGVPGTNGFELVTGSHVTIAPGPQLAAQSVQLGSHVRAGDTFYVDKVSVGSDTTYTPKIGFVPLFTSLPTVPAAGPGGPDVSPERTATLPPGNYGKLDVRSSSDITFAGGTYTFTSIEIGSHVTLRFAAPTTIVVNGQIGIGSGITINASDMGALPARQVILYVLGADGPRKTNALDIGSNSRLALDVYVPNGTLSVGSNSTSRGAFIGRRVSFGSHLTLNLDSAFQQP